jgi:hypothetical protein
MSTQRLKMAVIPKPLPGTRSVLVPDGGAMASADSEKTDLVCDQCDAILVEQIGVHNMYGIVIECTRCGFFNEVPI